MRITDYRRPFLLAAVLGPPAATAVLVPFRDDVANTNAALALVVVVVAVAAGGHRLPGVLAALSAGFWFDLLLTRPYGSFAIDDRTDAETTLLLLVVGIAVSELAVRGRRMEARAARAEGYVAGIETAVDAIPADAAPGAVVERVAAQIAAVLGAQDARFDYGTGRIGGGHPQLRPDGAVEVNGVEADVERYGLPHSQDLEILLDDGGSYLGRFVVTPGPGAHPSLAQRLAAVTLAERAAAALRSTRTPRSP